jgi:dihydrofolate reductase
MGKLILFCNLTLDGVIDSTAEWVDLSPEHQAYSAQLLAHADALVLGRHLYEGFKAVWPGMRDSSPIGPRINDMPKWVASRTLTAPLEWNGRLLDTADPMGHLGRIKAETDGTLVSTGGGALAASLVQAGLVDELRLFVNPVVWGPGQRLFHEKLADARFELVRADAAPGRVFELVYRPQLG